MIEITTLTITRQDLKAMESRMDNESTEVLKVPVHMPREDVEKVLYDIPTTIKM